MDDLHFFRQHETLFWKPAGERLFQEGCRPDGVWLLHSGTVHLLFSGMRGDARPLRVVEAPQCLCVSDLLSARVLDCSAVTHTPCLLGFIARETFLKLMSDDPNGRLAILQTQSDELTACYECMRMIGSGRQRV